MLKRNDRLNLRFARRIREATTDDILKKLDRWKVMSKKSSSTLAVDELLLGSMFPRKTFNYHQGASITSLDFDDSGQYLISAGIDKSIQLYDIYKGVHYKDIQSQKYGAHLARFTHKELNCLYVSTAEALSKDPVDNAIRYLSLSDKKYIRYFKGHKQQVISLEVNPVHDTFITSSYDNTVKLWDLRSPNPVGNLEMGQPTLIAYDPHGIAFVVAKYPLYDDGLGEILFFDTKTFYQAPFLTCKVQTNPKAKWTHVLFANHGRFLMISTNISEHYIIDAFLGELLTTLVTSTSSETQLHSQYPLNCTSCFTPCGRYAICGTPDNKLKLFNLQSIKSSNGVSSIKNSDNPKKLFPFKVIPTNQGLPKIIAFNPKLLNIATADNTVSLWQPS